MLKLGREQLFYASIENLERLAKALGITPPSRMSTNYKGNLVNAIQREEKRLEREPKSKSD